MQEKDILATFKKHIGDIDFSQNAESEHLRIHNFGEDIKSVNEFAGVLQTLQICFSKILHLAQSQEQSSDKNTIKSQIQDHVKDCQFLGKNLFDSTFSAKVGMTIVSLENPSPMPLLDKPDMQEFIGYIQDKNAELVSTLNLISQAIASENLFANNKASLASFEDFSADFLAHKNR